jgi:hypothetical protein
MVHPMEPKESAHNDKRGKYVNREVAEFTDTTKAFCVI